jgi:hypothetical protein
MEGAPVDSGCGEPWAEPAPAPALFGSEPPETELQFFTRRALEENRLARTAATPQAAAAHAYLAAAYSAQIARELAKEAELEALLVELD